MVVGLLNFVECSCTWPHPVIPVTPKSIEERIECEKATLCSLFQKSTDFKSGNMNSSLYHQSLINRFNIFPKRLISG